MSRTHQAHKNRGLGGLRSCVLLLLTYSAEVSCARAPWRRQRQDAAAKLGDQPIKEDALTAITPVHDGEQSELLTAVTPVRDPTEFANPLTAITPVTPSTGTDALTAITPVTPWSSERPPMATKTETVDVWTTQTVVGGPDVTATVTMTGTGTGLGGGGATTAVETGATGTGGATANPSGQPSSSSLLALATVTTGVVGCWLFT
ncbi:hypothetical protein GGTG_09121 [Gaeumannomyces tritici R3-111a-1]|uniref:Uncharacterized protein n=1 Tax=Gaeumannomyces tritici (strain R3-111a-1) TaxID=644352 RepID=J3P6I0_GAET3|nr:hypothetical protein GGTG_09121 [Gaeumannomyces tritici R3-111a-1]EJT72255.1 hypothetical protein GGTG_09121 [Gaeumannomyces tritici R3-111a-1]